MRAVLSEGGSDVRLVEIPDPTVGDQNVLIRVGARGICASELHLKEIKARITELPYPFVAGHKMAESVVQVHASVSSERVRDHVVVHPAVCCTVVRASLGAKAI